VSLDLAAGEIDDEEAFLVRRLGKIDDCDRVARPNPVAVERGLRLGEQLRIDAGWCRRGQNLSLRLRGQRREWVRRRRSDQRRKHA
jgi:hypothetical protein